MALTIIQSALRLQRSILKGLDGRLVTLTRGATSVSASATIGETRSDELFDDNFLITIRVRDFLIDVSEYQFGAGAVKPIQGDKLTYNGEIWEVMPTNSEPEYRRHDRDKTTWRIHYKKIGDV